MDLSEIDAVLLDMDGTLVESHAAVIRAWRTWSVEYSIDTDAVLAVAHGATAEATARQFLSEASESVIIAAAARQLALQYEDLSDVIPGRGAQMLLAVLTRRKLAWAVVTSADTRLARARLSAAGITPPVLVTIEDVSEGKPAPEGYRRAAELLSVPPKRCLVVEDTDIGVQAGRAAGARTAGLRGPDADLRLDDLTQLAHLLVQAAR